MMLLQPLIAAIAAGICVPILLALYLLKLRRRPVRVSTTAFWEQAAEDLQANVPLKWLRISLLLLLHLFIIVLLCLALGRPVSRDSAAAGSKAYLALDCSASMQALMEAGGTRTRLDEAKKKLKAEARRLTTAGASVGLISFAAQARVAVVPTTRASVIEEALDAAVATDQPGNVAAVLALVRGSVQEADEKGEGKSKSGRLLLEIGSDRNGGGEGDSNIDVRFVNVGADGEVDNLGITAIAAKREISDPSAIKVFLRLVNSGAKEQVAPCVVELDGAVIERFTVAVPGSTAAALGETSVARSIANVGAGVLKVSITREDLLAVDNSAAIVIESPRPPRVLLVSPTAVATESGSEKPAEWMLAEVLSQIKPIALEKARLSTYSQYAASGELAKFDAVVFDRVTPASPPPVASLSFGASVPEAGFELGPVQKVEDRPTVWDRTHVVLRDAPLDALFVSQTHELAEPKGRDVKVLARSKGGPLMLVRGSPGPKRIVVGFELGDSNWPLETSFAIFVSEAIAYLSAKEDVGASSLSTGDPVRIQVDGGANGVKFDGPEVREVQLTGGGASGGAVGRRMVVVEPLARVGVYKVVGGNASPDVLAVSLLNSGESDLRASVGGEEASALPTSGLGGGRELWPWCVIAAFGLLTVEWFVFGIQARK